VQTTQRYAHLAPDPLRDSADRITEEISSALSCQNSDRMAENSNLPGTTASGEPQ
jgi:hypothetical protein